MPCSLEECRNRHGSVQGSRLFMQYRPMNLFGKGFKWRPRGTTEFHGELISKQLKPKVDSCYSCLGLSRWLATERLLIVFHFQVSCFSRDHSCFSSNNNFSVLTVCAVITSLHSQCMRDLVAFAAAHTLTGQCRHVTMAGATLPTIAGSSRRAAEFRNYEYSLTTVTKHRILYFLGMLSTHASFSKQVEDFGFLCCMSK